jgi:hypothetical protein
MRIVLNNWIIDLKCRMNDSNEIFIVSTLLQNAS